MTLDRKTRGFIVVGLVAAAAVAIVISQFASRSPDGLEYVANQQGFADTEGAHAVDGSPLAGYGEGLSDNAVVGRAAAGLVGVVATFGVGYALFWSAGKRRRGTTT